MKTFEHFGKLFSMAKTDGVKTAMKYDVVKTFNRYPRIRDALIGAYVYQAAGSATPPKDDTGFAYAELGADGEIKRIVRRDTYSDWTRTSERVDGQWVTRSELTPRRIMEK